MEIEWNALTLRRIHPILPYFDDAIIFRRHTFSKINTENSFLKAWFVLVDKYNEL
jgi:hypothetical protein